MKIEYRSISDKNWKGWEVKQQKPKKPKPVKISDLELKSKDYMHSWRP